MHDDRWRAIVARAHVPQMVEDFLTEFGDRYGDAQVSDEELRLTAFEAFAHITDVLTGAMPLEDMEAHSQALGRRRAQQGVELAWLIDAIQLDFTILWSHLRTAAGADQDTLIDHVSQIHSVVTSYNLMVRDAFLLEEARSHNDAQLAHARHVERLFSAEQLDPFDIAEVARALGVGLTDSFDVVVAHPSAAIRLNSLLRSPISTGQAFGHGFRGTFVAFWPMANQPASTQLSSDLLVTVPGVRFPHTAGLEGVRNAARQAPSVFAATGELSMLYDAPELLWAVAGDALANFEHSGINELTRDIDTLRWEHEPVYETLVAFLDSGSVKDTARTLGCHRNTVINRLRQVTDTTGLDISHPKDAAKALLALRRAPH